MHAALLSLTALGAATAVSASYAPSYVNCDGSAALRLAGTPAGENQTLNTAEKEYVSARRSIADQSLKAWLAQSNLTSTVYGGSLDGVNSTSLPTISIALSGGGDRAALYGAGVLNALDGRNSTSVEKGTGGLLQAATYLSGLSGGSWLLSSFVFNDMPEIYPMVLGDGSNSSTLGWHLSNDLFSPGTANQSSAYVKTLFADVAAKKAAGNWNVTLNDVWARALSYHFLPGTTFDNFFNASADHAASLLFSSATTLNSWANHSLPFPLIVANVDTPNDKMAPFYGAATPLSSVSYEFSPLEFGSFDPELASFIPMKSLGTSLKSGTPVGQCVEGFDNAGWVLGTSSMLFHLYNVSQIPAWTLPASPIYQLVAGVNSTFYAYQPEQQLDIAALPSPFQGIRPGTYEDSNETQLRLIDGGLDGQVDPIFPLIVAARDIDVIIVADATADSVTQTPTGASLVATEQRAALLPAGTVTLPPLPNSNTTYLTQGLVTRPVFFGCNVTASTLKGNASSSNVPLLVYLPNNDNGLGITNTSTSQLVYPDAEATSFLDTASAIVYNGWDSDAEWPTCLACAVVERTRGREGVDRTQACEKCFDKYCWSEVEATTTGGGGNSSTGGSSGGGNGTSGGGNGTASGGAPASAASRGGEWMGVNAAIALGVVGVALLWA